MRIKVGSLFFALVAMLATTNVTGQSANARAASASAGSDQQWSLPQGTAVKDSGARTYRFSVVYNIANKDGEIIMRQQITGDYTRGLEGGDVQWKNVSRAEAIGASGPFPASHKQDFMEGFRYHNNSDDTVKADFFKGFPPTAVFERNLVWDTGMIEMFGQNNFGKLKLNEPYHAIANEDVKMPDVGTFHNHDVVLEWIGNSRRNGQDCALITYKAFFNPVDIANGGMTMKARSDYWGEIWVSLATKQIEFATIYEEVQGEMKLPNQDAPQGMDVFRTGTFEPLETK